MLGEGSVGCLRPSGLTSRAEVNASHVGRSLPDLSWRGNSPLDLCAAHEVSVNEVSVNKERARWRLARSARSAGKLAQRVRWIASRKGCAGESASVGKTALRGVQGDSPPPRGHGHLQQEPQAQAAPGVSARPPRHSRARPGGRIPAASFLADWKASRGRAAGSRRVPPRSQSGR